jgi:hypothetical protein
MSQNITSKVHHNEMQIQYVKTIFMITLLVDSTYNCAVLLPSSCGIVIVAFLEAWYSACL